MDRRGKTIEHRLVGEPQRAPHFGQPQDVPTGPVYLVNMANDQVIDIKDEKCTDKQPILVYPRNVSPKPHQQWYLDAVEGNKFYIASALHRQYVLDVKDAKIKSGNDVILYERKTPVANNQLWEWQGNTIHSAAGNDLVLAAHGSSKSQTLIIETRNGNQNQSWREVRA